MTRPDDDVNLLLVILQHKDEAFRTATEIFMRQGNAEHYYRNRTTNYEHIENLNLYTTKYAIFYNRLFYKIYSDTFNKIILIALSTIAFIFLPTRHAILTS